MFPDHLVKEFKKKYSKNLQNWGDDSFFKNWTGEVLRVVKIKEKEAEEYHSSEMVKILDSSWKEHFENKEKEQGIDKLIFAAFLLEKFKIKN
jgi:uncharacterized phage protein gp47/JayE